MIINRSGVAPLQQVQDKPAEASEASADMNTSRLLIEVRAQNQILIDGLGLTVDAEAYREAARDGGDSA